MIIFHEGLPRSGKSYEACINQILPALQKGRKVYTNIDGINRVKFAEVSGLPLETIIELLHPITEDQIKDVQNHVPDDCLVLLDELQDYFPAGKATLDEGITKFVTQHGHRGIDIVAMGQDHRDCHMLWKRRIDQLIVFVKRDAIGQPDSYTWTTFKQQRGKFVKLRSGKGNYDLKYFGLYKSHLDGVKSIDAHQDDRINILKSKAFTFWIPAFIVVLFMAIYYLWSFFHSTPVKVPKTEVTISEPKLVEQTTKPVETIQQQPVIEPPSRIASQENEYIEKYLSEYRPRLVALVECRETKCINKKKQEVTIVASVEFVDSSNHVYEKLSIKQIEAFGYTVERTPYGLLLKRGDKRYPVTAFPVELSKGVTRPLDEE